MTRAEESQPGVWEKTFPNQLPALMRAIDEVSAFLSEQGANPQALYTTQLAIEELGTNIIKYGYDDRSEHGIILRAHCPGDLIELQISDDGHAFDPCSAPEPNREATLDERVPGGWGLSLVRKLVKYMEYQRSAGRNVLTLWIDRV